MQKINLIKCLLNEDNIILIDNIFPYFDKYSKIEFIGFLKKYQIENNITIVYTTNNLEDIIFSDRVVVIDKEVLYNGNIDNFYCDEKLLKNRIANLVIYEEMQHQKQEHKGQRYRWLPSSAKEPEPEHQLLYGKIFNYGEGDADGNMPAERYGCQCGIEWLD